MPYYLPMRASRFQAVRRAATLFGALFAIAFAGAQAPAPAPFDLEETTIADLQQRMQSGRETSRSLVDKYLARIDAVDRSGPALHSVLEINPDARTIADRLDAERRSGRVRGPLHGIPILIKDNVATADAMMTTAGSLALAGAKPPKDAFIVSRLREAGAVILGKTNLSEWANFRSTHSTSGWSGRGGLTKNPYALDRNSSGSSSGSGASIAANLAAAAVGTETDGSITFPSGLNSLVGLKPTVGLVAQQGIIPIAFSQDTAGPMGRTATDAAILLGVLQSPFPAVGLTPPADLPQDYRSFLRAGALRGARIGVDPLLFDFAAQGFPPEVAGQFDLTHALAALESAGAVLVQGVSSADVLSVFDPELQVLLSEFKVGIRRYLSTLGHTPERDLADLIAFNRQHCDEELVYFGQELFEMAQATKGLDDPAYQTARATCLELTRQQGIDRAFRQHRLDAIVGPTFGVASTTPAVAGYPHVSVPGGFDGDGVPIGMSLFAQPWDEGKLLGYAFALERAAGFRRPPRLRGSVPPPPPRFDGCGAGSSAATGDAEAAAAAASARPATARPGR
jgi:amidase